MAPFGTRLIKGPHKQPGLNKGSSTDAKIDLGTPQLSELTEGLPLAARVDCWDSLEIFSDRAP